MDVSAWLRELGLERYEPAFRKNQIGWEVLPELTEGDLEKLGLPLGPRKKLVKAIANLSGKPTAVSTEAAASPKAVAPDAERRQLTVMFVDLVGSTELSVKLDPEDMRELIRAYQAACARAIARFEGHVARFLGDGALAYFGWPKAHEDDAERAVHAGLALVEELGRLPIGTDARLAARVGVATGQVVVGDLTSRDASDKDSVIGETPNLAARLQAVAEPGTVVISQATRKLVGGLFELVDLGPQRLKGFAKPLQVWRVLGASRAEGRFEARKIAGLTPLVGREEELALLMRHWQQAKDGEGQAVLLAGEPGIGKSRLMQEFRERVKDEPQLRFSYHCSPYRQFSPLHPVIQQLERAVGFEQGDTPEARLNKLEAMVARGINELNEAVPLLAAVLGVPAEDRYASFNLTPGRRKQRVFEVLIQLLEGLALKQPVLELYEDIHWADASSLELLGMVVDRVPRMHVLVVMTFRPEFQPPWTAHDHVTLLRLNRLADRHGVAMIERLAWGKELPPEATDQILAKADGVPLFLEELTKTVLELNLVRDAGEHYELRPHPPLALPATLHDSLMARLDRLGSAKLVAQVAAVIGGDFGQDVLAAVTDMDQEELAGALSQLVVSEIVSPHGSAPNVTYSFKHQLMCDAAYGSLLRGRRRKLHARIAAAITARFPRIAVAEPESVARHLAEAGFSDRAVKYWKKAGEVAHQRGAYRELLEHARRGLALLGGVPHSTTRSQEELELQLMLADALRATAGSAAVPTGEACRRARELADHLRAKDNLVKALFHEFLHHYARTEFDRAEEVTARLRLLTSKEPGVAQRLAALDGEGFLSFSRGQFECARRLLGELAMVAQESPQRPEYLALIHIDALIYLGFTFLALGFIVQGYDICREAMRSAEKTADPLKLAITLANHCRFFHAVGDPDGLELAAARLRQVCMEWRLTRLLAYADMCRGWLLATKGSGEEAAPLLLSQYADKKKGGFGLDAPQYLGLIADGLAAADEADSAERIAFEAVALCERTDERNFEAELYTLLGRLAAQRHQISLAESRYRVAIDVSRGQRAKLFELRAATGLSRLWRDQGKHAEAHDLLAPIYDWFTEGFDTADLKDAKALLDELA